MIDLEKAIAFVQSSGDEIERARLYAILWDAPPPHSVLMKIAESQHADGGFTYWCREASNICDTAYILQWLEELHIYDTLFVNRACQYLIDHQKEDGGWDEVQALRDLPVPDWMVPGILENRLWLTAFCAHILIHFGYAEAPGTRCPADFLLAHCDKAGRIKGYLRTTWTALPMLAFYPGKGSEAFKKAVQVLEKEYRQDWNGGYLAWLLHCLQDADLESEHPLVKRCLTDLAQKQRGDGSWEPEKGEDERQTVNATIVALRGFHRSGFIE
jgi:hypothetical protein